MKAIRYIALLRGINVSGHNIIRMEALRACFDGLGCRNSQTYLQSGNVIFESGHQDAVPDAQGISKRIRRDFGFAVPVVLRTAGELERIVQRNPFLKKSDIDQTKLHVTFLSTSAPKSAAADLKVLARASEQFDVHNREIYLYCPNGYGRTKFSNNAIEAKLRLTATTRNWKSVQALLALAQS